MLERRRENQSHLRSLRKNSYAGPVRVVDRSAIEVDPNIGMSGSYMHCRWRLLSDVNTPP
jgi:hypothetical protein